MKLISCSTLNDIRTKYKLVLVYFISLVSISSLYSQNILYTNISPTVIDTNEVFSFYIQLDSSGVDSIQVNGFFKRITSNGTRSFLIQNDEFLDTLILRDDGLGQDLIANDNIYTASNLQWEWDQLVLDRKVGSSVFLAEANVTYFYPAGNEITENVPFQMGIRYFNKNPADFPIINYISDSIQHTDYVINIIKDQEFGIEWRPGFFNTLEQEKIKTLFNDFFEDDNDEIISGFTYPTWNESASGFHVTLKNDVEGICMDITTDDFPAEGYTVMVRGTMAPTLYVHEYSSE